jgi:hypothetical protein
MTDIVKAYIKEKRSTLSDSSITTYASVLKSLYKKVFDDGKIDWDNFKDTKKVLGFLKDVPPNRRKTILSALVIITNNESYREQMLSDVREYNKDISKQEKTPEQEANWVDTAQVKTVFDAVKADACALMKKKVALKPVELQEIQNYVILALLGGVFIPPRRSKDYCDFKIKNIDEKKDNYAKKGKLVFNSYKTAKTYGTQEVDIPKPLQQILNAWCKINPTDFLLFDSNMSHLTPVKLNQRLNKIFGNKKIAVNSLRHSYLTGKYAEHSKVDKELAEDVREMGTSKQMLTTYVKND